MIRIHKRARIVDEARHALTMFMLDLEEKYDLTYGEMFSILANRMSELAKYLVRAERHPDDPDKKGDEA